MERLFGRKKETGRDEWRSLEDVEYKYAFH